MEACCLLPLSQMCVGSPFSPIIQCSDAAPGGHGLAYSHIGCDEAQRWTRFCSYRGDYTMLVEDQDLQADPDDRCTLVVAQLPLTDYKWVEVGRPGGFKHIALEEFAAQNWALERRVASGEVGSAALEAETTPSRCRRRSRDEAARTKCTGTVECACPLPLSQIFNIFGFS